MLLINGRLLRQKENYFQTQRNLSNNDRLVANTLAIVDLSAAQL